MKALEIARYFLGLLNPEDYGDAITNLKLQKLLFYAQGYYLAIHNKPLFDEEIEAWTHGPVVPKLYHHFKSYGSSPIDIPENINYKIYSKQVKDLLNEIYNVYGQFSAWKLRNITHNELIWVNAYNNPYTKEIAKDDMKKYFKKMLS